MIKVAVLALDNCPLSALALPVDILNAAGVLYNRMAGIPEDPGFEVCVVSTSEEPVSCYKSVHIIPDKGLEGLGGNDVVIIGALADMTGIGTKYQELIKKLIFLHEQGVILASICSGAFLLAETGLLNGKEATTHWGLCRRFTEQFPEVRVKASRTVVDQKSLLSSGGTTAGGDLALYLVRKYCGDHMAKQCARVLLLDPCRSSQQPYNDLTMQIDHGDSEISQVQEWLDGNYFREVTVAGLANISRMSRRTFERRFKKATGRTPLRYLQEVRLEKAKALLETGDYTFETITNEVGYGDPSTFRRMFLKSTGLPPGVYRQRFGSNSIPE